MQAISTNVADAQTPADHLPAGTALCADLRERFIEDDRRIIKGREHRSEKRR